MERLDWKLTIKRNIMVLKIVGMWPNGDEIYGRNFYTLYAMAVVLFEISHLSFETINLYFIANDLEAVTATIFVLLMEWLGIFKAYYLTKNMKMLKQLMITLNSDLFQPKNRHQKDLVRKNLTSWKNLYAVFFFMAAGWLFFFLSFPIFDKTYRNFRLPFLAWYPHDITLSPNYQLTYMYQVVAIGYISMTNINIDSLIAALNMYIGAQFDIVSDDLRNLHKTSENINDRLKQIIHHHRQILKFADYANKFYNPLLLTEFFIGGICIGLAMFQMTVVPPMSAEFFSFFSYSAGISFQVFMYCWFGNEVDIKSSKLAYAVFESEWVEMSSEVRKHLIFFILRVQKSLNISTLGLFNLSLDTFMRIMRTAWSYFALLRQVNTQS